VCVSRDTLTLTRKEVWEQFQMLQCSQPRPDWMYTRVIRDMRMVIPKTKRFMRYGTLRYSNIHAMTKQETAPTARFNRPSIITNVNFIYSELADGRQQWPSDL
jgi:hypothetical protein